MALTLFATLTQTSSAVDIDGDVAGGPTSASSSSSSAPEIIQLYSNTMFDFLNGTIVNLATNAAAVAVVTGSSSTVTSAATAAAGANNSDMKQEGSGVMNSSRRQFSALSYQAVQTLGRDTDEDNNSTGVGPPATYPQQQQQQQQQQRQHLRPDLGVWDCRVDVELAAASNTNTVTTIIPRASILLKQVVVGTTASTTATTQKKTRTVLMTIDVSSNNIISMFNSIIEQMRNVILGAFTTKDNNSENNDMPSKTTSSSSSHTTSMKSLQHSTFGKAHINEVVTTVEGGDNDNMALILAAIVPSSSSTSTTTTSKGVDEYSERQTRALLSYHLRKFALELNCTLCFVSSDIVKISGNTNKEEEEKETSAMTETLEDPMISGSSAGSTTMSIDELAHVVRRIALGMSPIVIMEGEQQSSSLPLSSIYIPGTHDSELVYGPYLRNASCEGKWDATVDDLDVAFPPTPTKTKITKTRTMIDDDYNGGIGEGGLGDEVWLSQLATSIGITTVVGPLSPLHKPPTTPKLGGAVPAVEGGGKEKTSVPKKRVTRLSSTRNKDTTKTRKDEKEVMNFFDNLLKK